MQDEVKVSQAARDSRVARYLSDQKAARENLAAYPEKIRQRLEAWQTEQREWFSDTILEIVAEFITIDDATATKQSARRWHGWSGGTSRARREARTS